jgi:glycerophosphoryl diester phosphodiesterase
MVQIGWLSAERPCTFDRCHRIVAVELIAHRGFPEEGVENALPRLQTAASRADAVEFDIRKSCDGVPVVCHDERVDRLTDASGPVGAFPASELTELALAGTDATIPTLEGVLEAVSGPIVPDLKVESVDQALLAHLEGYDGPVLASSFRPSLLSALPAGLDRAILVAPPDQDREWPVPAATPTSMDEGVDLAASLAAEAVHPHASLCTAEAVTRAKSAGFAVNAWTIRSRETARAVRAAGVDGAIADSPRYVRKA